MGTQNLTCEACGAPAVLLDKKHSTILAAIFGVLIVGLGITIPLVIFRGFSVFVPAFLFVAMLVAAVVSNKKNHRIKCTKCGVSRSIG